MEEKIYLKLEKDPENISDLIKSLYRNIHASRILRGVETYKDKECSLLQCPAAKYRSFEDMMIIANTYFPGTTEQQLLQELIKPLTYNGIKMYIYLISCVHIQKITIGYYTEFKTVPDWYDHKRKGKYSWKELFESIGINSLTELEAYIKKEVPVAV